jgi:hypothetical protein
MLCVAFSCIGVILSFSFSSLFSKAAKSNMILVGFCIHVPYIVYAVLPFEISLRSLAVAGGSRDTV